MRLACVIVAILSTLGCTRMAGNRDAMPAAMMESVERSQASANTFSQDHSVVVDLPERALGKDFRQVADRYAKDSVHHCTIL